MKETTIGVSQKTKEMLRDLKEHPRQSYEEIILWLIKHAEEHPDNE